MWRGGRAAGAAALGLLVVLPAAAACTVAARPTVPLTGSVLARWCPGGGAAALSVKLTRTSSSSTHTDPRFHLSQGVLASFFLHPGHSLHRALREGPLSVRSADDNGQTYLFGGPSPGNPSVPSNATCTSSPRRTAPWTGKHSLLFCLAVRTAYCTADPTFVGAGNCAAPGSIGEHEDEDRSASEAAMDSTIWRRCGPAWWPSDSSLPSKVR